MKKKGLVTGAVAMALAVSMAFMPATAKAETVDNVDVTVTTDKTEYSSGEEVKLNVNVKNNNSYELKSPNITFQLPDGLTVDGKSTYSYDFNSISSGATTDEVVELKNVTVTDNNSQVTNPTQDSNSEITKPTEGSSSEITKPTVDSNSNVTVPTESDNLNVTNPTMGSNSEVTVPTQDSNSNVIASTENNSDDKQAETKAPQTGDTAKTIIYVITLLLAVSGIIFIVLKKKKIASSLLVLALIATGLAVIPSSSVKAAINKSVTGKVTVKVDAKDADINYAFTYSVDTVSDDNGSTDTTQPSGGSSTEVTNRSEIGQKILEHKNSEEVEGIRTLFYGTSFETETVTNKYGVTQKRYIRKVSNDCFTFRQPRSINEEYVQYVFYDSNSDIVYYAGYEGKKLILTKDTVSFDDYVSKREESGVGAIVYLSKYISDYDSHIDDLYIGALNKDGNLVFTCKYLDYPKYADIPEYNNCTMDVVSTELNDGGTTVKVTFDYSIDGEGGRFDYGYYNNIAVGICTYDGADNLLYKSIDKTKLSGTVSFDIKVHGNGTYYYQLYIYGANGSLSGMVLSNSFTVDCFKTPESDTPIPAEKFEPATVTISGTPDDTVSFGTPVTMKMTTDKPCTMSFNGQPVSSDYATSGNFTVTANGTYSYVAVTEQGVPTTGTFTVDFFTGSAFNTRNDWKDPADLPLLP